MSNSNLSPEVSTTLQLVVAKAPVLPWVGWGCFAADDLSPDRAIVGVTSPGQVRGVKWNMERNAPGIIFTGDFSVRVWCPRFSRDDSVGAPVSDPAR